jgi:uncharacterized membrane protein
MNTPTHQHETHQPTKETARVEAFSDGVFAIAITLLVIELIQLIHEKEHEKLLSMLLHNWASLFAFGLGFLTILICWINHHVAFDYIIKTNSKLMWVNAFVLLMVTFTPFAIAVLAQYFESERNHAMALFGFNYLLMSLAAYCLCAYGYKQSLIDENHRKTFHRLVKLYEYSIYYTFVAFLVCFFSAPVAVTLYCALFVVFAFPKAAASKLIRIK